MTRPRKTKEQEAVEVQLAKDIAKLTKAPLPRVAQVLQKYPLNDPKSTDLAIKDCLKVAAEIMQKDLDGMFNMARKKAKY